MYQMCAPTDLAMPTYAYNGHSLRSPSPKDEHRAFKDIAPEKKLAYAVICNALKDAVAKDWMLSEAKKLEAREWLFSDSNARQSANWWAEMGDMEEVLRICREALKSGWIERNREKVFWMCLWEGCEYKKRSPKCTI